MRLYPLLQDRLAVNMLKALYDNEVERGSYAMRLADIRYRFPGNGLTASAQRLVDYGLASADAVEHDAVFSITDQGKHFIEIFDQLVTLANGTATKKPAGAKVRYQLTQIEKQILVLADRITEESHKPSVSAHAITRELFPNQEARKKVPAVLRHLQQLTALGLATEEKIARHTLVKVTEAGKRAIKEQYWKEAV